MNLQLAAVHGYAHFSSLLRDMRTMPNDALPPAVLHRCVGVQYPVVGCHNVNMGGFSW